MTRPLVLRAVPGAVAVCRMPADAQHSEAWLRAVVASRAPLVSVTRTDAELSIVCPKDLVPPGARVEAPWHAYAVDGTLDFALVGILVRLTTPLASAGISVFAISTFDTDYLLVPAASADAAVRAWLSAGIGVVDQDASPG